MRMKPREWFVISQILYRVSFDETREIAPDEMAHAKAILSIENTVL